MLLVLLRGHRVLSTGNARKTDHFVHDWKRARDEEIISECDALIDPQHFGRAYLWPRSAKSRP